VEVWVVDEAHFGLPTEVRGVWITEGKRPEVNRQTKYDWDYLYGALEVVEEWLFSLTFQLHDWNATTSF
jgi:hypothetical protein